MDTIFYLLALLFVKHLIVDFYLQPQEMGVSKATSLKMLTLHCSMHFVGMLLLFTIVSAFIFYISAAMVLLISFLDYIFHWTIDFCSSRIKNLRGLTPRDHEFWNLIGLDQFLHYISYLIIVLLIVI